MAAAYDEYLKKLYNARSMVQQPQQQGQAGTQGTAGDIDLSKASPAGGAGGGFNIAGTSRAAQAGLSQYGQRYQMSDAVSQAKDYLQGVMANKPGEYSSNYSGQIQALYNQIMNRPEFKYDVNKDPLFQSYKNNYMQTGQRAMQDAVGTAAGLTGGYGNSWGATAGFQAYQWYLQQLNNAIPELEQRAFDKYQYYGDELRNNMNMSMALDEMEYGRYRDTVQDWMAERSFANAVYGQERNWDMADWQGLQDYYQNLAAMETSSYRQDRAEDLDWARLAEQQRQYDTDEAYRRDMFSEDTRRYNQDFGESQRQFNENLDFQRYAQALDEAYRRDQMAENIRQYNQDFGESQRQFNENLDFQRYAQALDEAYRRDTMAENIRQYEQNFGENVRQANLDEAYRRDTMAENIRQYEQNFGENVRQADLDEAYRRDTLAEQQRQYNQNFAEDQRQFNENKDFQKYVQALDEAYRRDTLAENVRQADLDEAYRRDTMAENIRQYEQNFGENVRQANLDEAYRRDTLAENVRQADLDEAYRRDTMAENIRQYEQNFGENVRQADLDEAYRRDTLAENVRQADLDEAYRQSTFAEQQRQYNQNFAEDQRQFNENKDFQKYVQALDEAYRRDTLAENIRQADLDEAYRQATFAENIRQYNQNFGEDVRQYDTSLAEKQREFDLGYGLDQAQFDFQVRQYEEALAAAGLAGNGGGGGDDKPPQDVPQDTTQNAGQTKPLNPVYMPELVDIARINAEKNPALSNLASPESKSLLTEALEKDLKSQKGDMVTLPITPIAADGTINQGPLAQRTQPMPREQAEELISAMEDLNKQLKKQTTTAKKQTGTQGSTSTSAKNGTSTLDQLMYGTRKQK